MTRKNSPGKASGPSCPRTTAAVGVRVEAQHVRVRELHGNTEGVQADVWVNAQLLSRANEKVCVHKILAKNTTAITPKIKNATTAALERARSWSSTATT